MLSVVNGRIVGSVCIGSSLQEVVQVQLSFNINHVDLSQFYFTRLLGRFAPIFFFNCEHVLFVYIVKQNKKVRGFHKTFLGIFKKKIKFCWRIFFWNFDLHKPSMGLREVPQKNRTRSVQPFGRLLDRHPNRQTKFL